MLGKLIELVRGAADRGGGGEAPDGDLAPAEARQRLSAGSVLVDVRESDEWAAGHAAGARHIPLGQIRARSHELPRDREIITVCRSGNRSARAAGMLRGAGFSQVRNLAGGMTAWAKEGLSIEREPSAGGG